MEGSLVANKGFGDLEKGIKQGGPPINCHVNHHDERKRTFLG
jgi:hypothetical protein